MLIKLRSIRAITVRSPNTNPLKLLHLEQFLYFTELHPLKVLPYLIGEVKYTAPPDQTLNILSSVSIRITKSLISLVYPLSKV